MTDLHRQVPAYSSYFNPSPEGHRVLHDGKIIGFDEEPSDMVNRVVEALSEKETFFSGSQNAAIFADTLGELMDRGKIVMSTPIMTNAGRYLDRPLSACTVPTTPLTGDRTLLAQEITLLHQQGMGTGFNLDDVEDPVGLLDFLNRKAVDGAKSGMEDRPVGNMAILDIHHPKIVEFIRAKLDAPNGAVTWKFNISVNADEDFFRAVNDESCITLWDGKTVSAQLLFDEITSAAHKSADPGLIFLDRMNRRNPTPHLGQYRTTAPCAEVGLVEGEACQFGYVNLGAFIHRNRQGLPVVDVKGLEQTARVLTRALDDALEISIGNYASNQSVFVMEQKRKIGIGVCGVADALNMLGLPYDSNDARQTVLNMLALINYSSKQESVTLADERGSAGALKSSLGSRHTDPEEPLLVQLYGNINTAHVKAEQWIALASYIRRTKLLRNVTTVSLPPTGRSALVIDASTGIEPHFQTSYANANTRDALLGHIRRNYGDPLARQVVAADFRANTAMPLEVRNILASATEIEPVGHVAMAATCQLMSDEAVAKTINLPPESTPQDIAKIYFLARSAGMSGITVYRQGTFGSLQPKELDN